MAARFSVDSSDYGLMVNVKCKMQDDGGYPNQADLRRALDNLLTALSNWDIVDVEIKTFDVYGQPGDEK